VIYVLAIIVGVCALGAVLVAFTRRPPRDDVARFHRAAEMTTEWSRTYASTGDLQLPNERNGHEHEQTPDAEHLNGNSKRVNGRQVREPAEHR
jgi:hypothetical protein